MSASLSSLECSAPLSACASNPCVRAKSSHPPTSSAVPVSVIPTTANSSFENEPEAPDADSADSAESDDEGRPPRYDAAVATDATVLLLHAEPPRLPRLCPRLCPRLWGGGAPRPVRVLGRCIDRL